jgi:pimeloyl-ACP methyl ester carboxylesterase
VTLAYRESGSGPPFVLLHAFPLSAAMWEHQYGPLGRVSRLITPDLPGFGRSPSAMSEPAVNLMADEVSDLLTQLGLDAVVLGGLSMGGYVTMGFLRRHPERVRAIVLADTKAGADAEAARANRERIAEAMLATGDTAALAEELLPTLLGKTTLQTRPGVVELVRSHIRASEPAAVAWAQRAMAARPDSVDTLRNARLPALVIVGEEDVLTPPAEAEAMASALPHADLVRIPQAGHLSALEHAAAFNDAITSWLTNLTLDAPPTAR